jgi:hypothetical protein
VVTLVINSTNIKQNEQLPLIFTKKKTTYDVGNPGPGLEQTQACGGVKPVNGIPTFPS